MELTCPHRPCSTALSNKHERLPAFSGFGAAMHTDRRDLSRELTRLSSELRYPKSALRRRAEQLGLTLWSHVRWTPEEIKLLEEYAGVRTIGWITRHLRAVTGIGRSYNSVKCKAEKIGRSLRLRKGYAQSDLAELFGTTESTVSK